MKRDKHVNGFSRLTHNAKLIITDNHWQFDHHCTTTDFANPMFSWNGKKLIEYWNYICKPFCATEWKRSLPLYFCRHFLHFADEKSFTITKNVVIDKYVCSDLFDMLKSPTLDKPSAPYYTFDIFIVLKVKLRLCLNSYVLGWFFIHCSCLSMGTYRNRFI